MKRIASILTGLFFATAFSAVAENGTSPSQSAEPGEGVKVEFSLPDAFNKSTVAAPAENAAAPAEKPKIKINPTGRILIDGAGYMGGNPDGEDGLGGGKFVSGMAVPDVRLGAKVSYGNWKAKIDMGFSYGKVGMKDIYMEYDFNSANFLRLGYFVQQFGGNSATSSSYKPTMIEQIPNEFFACNPRNLGLMYQHTGKKYLGAVGVYVEGDAVTNKAASMGKQAFGTQTRQVWRPYTEVGKIFQIGISLKYLAPTYNSNTDLNHTSFTNSVNFPSKVSQVTMLKSVVDHARGQFLLSPELLAANTRLAFEAQYYYQNIWRKDGCKDYSAQGVMAQFRSLLFTPTTYKYDAAGGGLKTPGGKSLEFVLGYSYTNATDAKAGVFGGISNDINATFNYYINDWMIARLRWSYTDVRDRQLEGMLGSRHVNIIQARLMISF